MSIAPSDQGHQFSPPPLLDDEDVEDLDLDADSYSDTDDFADVDGPDPSDYDDTDAPRKARLSGPPPLLDDEASAQDDDDPDYSDDLPGVALTDAHRAYLLAQGISAEYLDSPIAKRLIRSVTSWSHVPKGRRSKMDADESPTGIYFGFTHEGAERVQWQLRPDHPAVDADGRATKYTSRRNGGSPCGQWSESPNATPLHKTAVIAEGTKQTIAVSSALRHDASYTIIGITGCNGWSRGNNLQPAIAEALKGASEVIVIPDADAATNDNVALAMWDLRDSIYRRKQLKNGMVRFVRVPGAGKEGIDDVLAALSEDDRTPFVLSLIEDAVPTPTDKRPAKRRSKRQDDEDAVVLYDRFGGGLQVENCVKELLKQGELALDKNGVLYRADQNMVFHAAHEDVPMENHMVLDFLVERLGNDFRLEFGKHVQRALESTLRRAKRVIPEVPTHGLLAVRNGMVDPATGELIPREAHHLVTCCVNVEYSPDATAPLFIEWLKAATAIGDRDQFDVIMDATSVLVGILAGRDDLDRGLYLQGPPRAGKGTFMNGILASLIPKDYRSALDLHDLSVKKDALVLTLRGKVLNLAGETPEHYIADSSLLKRMLGMDPIATDVKFKNATSFYNRAFPVFSANDMPNINDTTGAIEARLALVMFTKSNVGSEDRLLLNKLQAELPGILNLLLEFWRKRQQREGKSYIPSDPQAVEMFLAETNPLASFMKDCVDVAPAAAWRGTRTVESEWATPKRPLYAAYRAYTKENGGQPMKAPNFLKAISRKPFNVEVDAVDASTKARVVAVRIKDDAPVDMPQGMPTRTSSVVDDAPPDLNPPV